LQKNAKKIGTEGSKGKQRDFRFGFLGCSLDKFSLAPVTFDGLGPDSLILRRPSLAKGPFPSVMCRYALHQVRAAMIDDRNTELHLNLVLYYVSIENFTRAVNEKLRIGRQKEATVWSCCDLEGRKIPNDVTRSPILIRLCFLCFLLFKSSSTNLL